MSRWGVVAVLVACTSAPTGSGSQTVSQTKKPGMPKPSVNWVKGPALTSSATDLAKWFEAQKRGSEPRMTRVPVVLTREKMGNTPGGFTPNGAKIGPLVVNLSDAALGIGIAMRARSCSSDTCAFIVEGFWRGKDQPYEIREASRQPIKPEELAAMKNVEVEGESGN